MPETIIPSVCEVCGRPLTHIPAGISRNNRPYPEFWRCDCGWTWNKPRPKPQPISNQSATFLGNPQLLTWRKAIDDRLTNIEKHLQEIQVAIDVCNGNVLTLIDEVIPKEQ